MSKNEKKKVKKGNRPVQELPEVESLLAGTGTTGPAGPIGPTGLQGPTGPQGNTGAPGPTGVAGNKWSYLIVNGITGAAGPVGPAGSPGSSGSSGGNAPLPKYSPFHALVVGMGKMLVDMWVNSIVHYGTNAGIIAELMNYQGDWIFHIATNDPNANQLVLSPAINTSGPMLSNLKYIPWPHPTESIPPPPPPTLANPLNHILGGITTMDPGFGQQPFQPQVNSYPYPMLGTDAESCGYLVDCLAYAWGVGQSPPLPSFLSQAVSGSPFDFLQQQITSQQDLVKFTVYGVGLAVATDTVDHKLVGALSPYLGISSNN